MANTFSSELACRGNHPPLGGTDGFRAEFTNELGDGRMNAETVAGLTHALVMNQTGGHDGLVVIGTDPRTFNPKLERAAVAGARAAGAEVIRLGVAPTPTILRTAELFGASAAVALTASHNKAKDGGWKGTLGSHKPFGSQVDAIDNRYWHQVDSGMVIPSTTSENIPFSPEHIERYIADVVANISEKFGDRPLTGKLFVVDAANGAAMNVTPRVLELLGATVERFACDGSSPINENCGATNLTGVQAFLLARPEIVQDPRFVGVLLNDGDADRMIGMGARFDQRGMMTFDELDGNRVFELLAPTEPGIVGTDYSNDASVDRIRLSGKEFEFCENGDVNVTQTLRGRQARGEEWNIGGEFSGHHVDMRWLSSGDGVRMAAWVAAHAATNSTTISEICQTLPLYPEKMRKLTVRSGLGTTALNHVKAEGLLKLTTEDMAHGLRLLVRESGTEKDAMRTWGVAKEQEYVNTRTEAIQDAMLQFAA